MTENPERFAESDDLDAFLKFADAVQATHERAHRPAYAETCQCGGSVEVSRDVPPAERRRLAVNFHGRHRAKATLLEIREGL